MKVLLARLRRSGGPLAALVIIVFVLGGVVGLRQLAGARETAAVPVVSAAVRPRAAVATPAHGQVPTPVARRTSAPLPEQPLPTADRTGLAEVVLLEAPAQELLDALNCTRAQQGKAALVLDSALAEDAKVLWQRLARDPGLDLRQAPPGMRLIALLPLDLGADVADAAESGCGFGGLELATLELEDVTAVGIAVVGDEVADAEVETATALILGR